MVDVRRHAPVARYRAPRLGQQHAYGLTNVSRGRARHIARDIYESDREADHQGRPFRWMLSTLLAAIVGMAVSGIVVYGSLRRGDNGGDLFRQLEAASRPQSLPATSSRGDEGLPWLTPKEDKLQVATSALTIRQLIHEQIRVRRNGKPFLKIKPYLRLSVRLAPASREYADAIPSFNPLKLFGRTPTAVATNGGADMPGSGSIESEVVDLLDGRLPAEDGQNFEEYEVTALVKQAIETAPDAPVVRLGSNGSTGLSDSGTLTNAGPASETSGRVTVLRRAPSARDGTPVSLEKRELRVVTAKPNDTLGSIVKRIGADDWQVEAISRAARRIKAPDAMVGGEQIYVTIVPSLETQDGQDVLKLSVFESGHTHRISIKRTSSGQFIASRTPDQGALIQAMSSDVEERLATLYAAVYGLGLSQSLTPEQITAIIRVHAHDVDFQRRVRPGDQLDLFFELNPDPNNANVLIPGEMIYTALTTGGETRRFWRFRSQDASVDYFDFQGQNARKFLLRKPVRGGNVRFTSGFGMRRHPILNRLRPHRGIDWAARSGTPIMAAGNG
ncbi:MAG: M23 family metallopeptidase, partial [Pseudomonadota bacterium]